jgi:alpha-mannosidase
MLRHPEYTRKRLMQLAERFRGRIYPEVRAPKTLEISPTVDRISHAEAMRLEYRPVALGRQLGPLFATHWFRVRAEIPEAWRGQRVDLLWISHSEATLWIDGKSVQGLNHHPAADKDGSTRPDAQLIESAQGGETFEFMIEAAANAYFGVQEEQRRPYKHVSAFVLDRCDVARFDPEAWALYFDLVTLVELEAESTKDLDKTWGGLLLEELNRFANACDPDDRTTWPEGQQILRTLYTRKNASTVHSLSAIGHAHIDTAWLWPMAETIRKCERTFSSQVTYMDAYPEHRFACSQALQYAFIQERNPDLWNRMIEKVRAGQFIPVGGTWVEPDCNLPSGESLARQFLYGQRFFMKALGVRCTELWQPDVFGYNGQLPQLMRLAGIRRFLTQKLSWNHFNKPAHHTFVWEGIDGSEVIAHFPPADTYNSTADVAELRRIARDYKDHDRSRESLMLFGHGDGGGGPTKRMLEVLRRAKDLEGLPRTELRTPDEFFTRLERDVRDWPRLIGELYFEYHRGTYTSQAETKAANRRSEELLHDVEVLSAIADRLGRAAYPKAEIEPLWKRVLTNQFHDILPGSSIAVVYEDARRDYREVKARGEDLRDRAAQALVAKDGGGATPINTLSFPRRELCRAPSGELLFVDAPPIGIGEVRPCPDRVRLERHGDRIVLENESLRAEIETSGDLVRLLDKQSHREALSGPSNILEIYDDHPIAYDAWDVDPFHLETKKACPPAERAEIVGDGPLAGEVSFERSIGKKSRIRQTVRLLAASRHLEFECDVDWAESNTMLKVAFMVTPRAMNATYEMQFGVAERPTHFNTSHDLARYEVPGHRFSDLSEHGFGVALLGDSKYGYSTHRSEMRMSLLRAPTSPDPNADRGHHRFRYAILPHAGGWQDGRVVEEARRFNVPILWAVGSSERRSFFQLDGGTLVIDGLKKAEDGDGLILRLYEGSGGRGSTGLRSSLPFTRAKFVNLLEEEIGAADMRGDGTVRIAYRPFEIISLKLE